MRLSVILPVHNERDNLKPLLAELAAVLAAYPASEIIAVDDGSTDGSLAELKSLTASFPSLKVIELATNYGQTAAIAAGMDAATGEVLLPMDADSQNDPSDIPGFLAKIDEGFDIVSGWRRDRHDAWLRSALSKVANRLIRSASNEYDHLIDVASLPQLRDPEDLDYFLPDGEHLRSSGYLLIAELINQVIPSP